MAHELVRKEQADFHTPPTTSRHDGLFPGPIAPAGGERIAISPLLQPMKDQETGKLRIGDNWNVIRIIALSQSNPLKAVAEFVENSIDAGAKHIALVRGKEHGVQFLRLKDDGEGIRRHSEGLPDFEYATPPHVGAYGGHE